MIIKMAKRSIFIGVLLFSVLLVSCKTAGKVNFPERDLADGKEANVQRVANSDEQESAIAKANTKETDSMNKEEILAKEAAILNARDLAAGTVLESAALEGLEFDELFYIKTRINGKSYKDDCDVPYDDLRYIRVLHKNFEGKTQIGELIINKSVAEDVLDIFKELYDADYPIERMVLIDEYDAEDNTSMAANNSSAFNFRFVDGTTKRSSHSDGLAIDINPLYNPYVRTRNGKEVVLPENGPHEGKSLLYKKG